MTITYYEELMADFGAKTVGSTAFGVAAGCWPYSAEMQREKDRSSFTFRFVVAGAAGAVAAQLDKERKNHTRWHAAALGGSGVLVAQLAPPSDFYAKSDIHMLLATAGTALAEAGLQPPNTCPLCGLPGCDTIAWLDGGCRLTHAACLESRLTLPELDVTPPTSIKGNVLTGILGALLGALIAILPNWAMAISEETVSWPLYAFVPLLSTLVYRLFRGKAIPIVAGCSVLLSSLLAAFALEQVWYWVYVSRYAGYTPSLWATIADYFATHNLFTAAREMLWGLVALGVGFIVSTILLRRYCENGTLRPAPVRGSRFVRQSALPFAPGIAAAPPQEDALAAPRPGPHTKTPETEEVPHGPDPR